VGSSPGWPAGPEVAGQRSADALAVATRLVGSHHAMGLVISNTRSTVRLAGVVDAAAAGDLRALLELVESVSTDVSVDLRGVTFLDVHGITPLIDTIRLRDRVGHGQVQIGARSVQAQLFLDTAGLKGDPCLDIAAWDRLTEPPATLEVPAQPIPTHELTAPTSQLPVGETTSSGGAHGS
jgi:anti-anti-sigma regulatory factor